MAKIKEQNKEAFTYLALLDPKTYGFNAMEETGKVEHITSNFVESFNHWMDELRFMSLYKPLDGLRTRLTGAI
ncbi:hypothetical protein PanWU01x14_039060 [Parasponia andersonii]|uniref:Uncharacterized protein n=1 Tax=Parasponia andersonii TaxID=3476 RepID=A0A2P5DRN6_PARAD|nr:hypothetical protein PanWU01x14_039060 [Parasponia andersonii]